MEVRNHGFDKVEQFLLRLALIVLLAIGLLKIVVPEAKSLVTSIIGGQTSPVLERQSTSVPTGAREADR